MYFSITPVIFIILVIVGGCAHYDSDFKLPGVYRIDIQQGNVIDQEMLDKLKPGMNRNQVRFIMGTPAISDPFHVQRWDYLYTKSESGGRRKQIHIALYFEEDKLAYLEGDVVTTLRKPTQEFKKRSRTIDVPIADQKKKGFFSKMIDAIPFVGDDAAAPPQQSDETDGVISEDTANEDEK